MPIPAHLDKEPKLLPGLELYMTAFHKLNTCRSIGFGLGPIPWTAVQQYGILLELDSNQTEALHYHMSRLDSAYLKWSNKKSNVKSD